MSAGDGHNPRIPQKHAAGLKDEKCAKCMPRARPVKISLLHLLNLNASMHKTVELYSKLSLFCCCSLCCALINYRMKHTQKPNVHLLWIISQSGTIRAHVKQSALLGWSMFARSSKHCHQWETKDMSENYFTCYIIWLKFTFT